MKLSVAIPYAISLLIWAFLWDQSVGFDRLVRTNAVIWWIPFLSFLVTTTHNFTSEGWDTSPSSSDKETAKLKSLDDWAGRLITVLSIVVGIIWYLVKDGQISPLRFDELKTIVVYMGACLFIGLLPMYWVQGGDDEAEKLFVIRQVRTAFYTHCICWTLILIIMLLYDVWVSRPRL